MFNPYPGGLSELKGSTLYTCPVATLPSAPSSQSKAGCPAKRSQWKPGESSDSMNKATWPAPQKWPATEKRDGKKKHQFKNEKNTCKKQQPPSPNSSKQIGLTYVSSLRFHRTSHPPRHRPRPSHCHRGATATLPTTATDKTPLVPGSRSGHDADEGGRGVRGWGQHDHSWLHHALRS